MKSSTGILLWVIAVVICVVLAFILFMGSVTGAGNSDLRDIAGYVIAIPVILIPLIIMLSNGSKQKDTIEQPLESQQNPVEGESSYTETVAQENPDSVNVTNGANNNKSKSIAGLLAILLGALGVHRFYLGSWGMGLINILLTIYIIGPIIPTFIAVIEGIRYLTLSSNEFQKKVDTMDGPLAILW